MIWSDETKINRFCSDGYSWCWGSDKNNLQEHQISQTVKHGGGSIIVWGCTVASKSKARIFKIQKFEYIFSFYYIYIDFFFFKIN